MFRKNFNELLQNWSNRQLHLFDTLIIPIISEDANSGKMKLRKLSSSRNTEKDYLEKIHQSISEFLEDNKTAENYQEFLKDLRNIPKGPRRIIHSYKFKNELDSFLIVTSRNIDDYFQSENTVSSSDSLTTGMFKGGFFNSVIVIDYLGINKEITDIEKISKIIDNYQDRLFKDHDEIVLSIYKIESEAIEDSLNTILGWRGKKGSFERAIISSPENYYNYFIPIEMLEVILTAADLKSRNVDLFRTFTIPKKDGSARIIHAPNDEINTSLKSFNRLLQKVFDKRNEEFQVAYKRGKSIKDNAKHHTEKEYVFNIDMKDFFPSCGRDLVKHQLKRFTEDLIYGEQILDLLLDSILINDALFIGNPVSGTLANAIISTPALIMKNKANSTGVKFSIYADDITFSSDKFLHKDYVIGIFNDSFNGLDGYESFRINEKKSHGMSGGRRRVTGVTINHRNEMTVKRSFYRDIRVKVHKLSIGEEIQGSLKTLRGQLAHAVSIDQSGKIRNLVDKFEDTFIKYKLLSPRVIEELRKGER